MCQVVSSACMVLREEIQSYVDFAALVNLWPGCTESISGFVRPALG